jgi:ferredoxin-NADP reductase/predicted pyridoxine 5'-phosphate oxidase superfamily flavin-nucleotide-binding protein
MSTAPVFPGWDLERSPFHAGELAVQERVGVRDKIDAQGRRAVRRYLTDQHREFFPLLPYAFVGSVDAQGRPWSSMLMGEPGFLQTPDAHTLVVKARPLPGDPLNETLKPGASIALMGVQLNTRRRNRAIGTVRDIGTDGFSIAVQTTLGLCPQYIQGREPVFIRDPFVRIERPVNRSPVLDATARAVIEKADTYFVASVGPRSEDAVASGADISHRGGRPGFVRVDGETTLTAPDFVGNFIFNTLGNLQIDNRAGLLFIDFETGDLFYIAARTEVIWDGPEVKAFTGAQRLMRYHVEEVIRVADALPARFSPPETSPLSDRTGTWAEAARTMEAERLHSTWRPFRLVETVVESAGISSFLFEPADRGGVAGYAAGQYLPIRVQPEGWTKPALRTYTLSDAPDGRSYRISVKREGKGGISDWLHDRLRPDDEIEVLSPRGSFSFDDTADRPVVMISAGVGITPVVAMLNSQLVNNGRTRLHKPIRFIHATTDGAHLAFATHLARKAELHSNLDVHLVFSRPSGDDELGRTHQSEGRIDRALLQRVLPLDDYEVYLCGPPGFMQTVYDALLSLGVRDDRIHFESFGPASITRRSEAAAETDAGEGVTVEFAKSRKTALWRPGAGSLLDLAEANGIAPLHSCRSGICGTCAVRVVNGDVDYAEPPAHEIADGEAMVCVARPRPGAHLDGSDNREGVTLDL